MFRNDAIVLFALTSLVMLIASWVLRDSWWGDLLLQVGSAAILLVPFLLFTKWLENQLSKSNETTQAAISSTQRAVEHLEQEVAKADMARTPSEIDGLIAKRLDEERQPDRTIFEALAGAPSREDIRVALRRALELEIIASFGVRVPFMDGSGLYLWFPYDEHPSGSDLFTVIAQKWDLERVTEFQWEPGVSTVDFFSSMAAELRETPYWVGDTAFRPAAALPKLSETLLFGHEAIINAETDRTSRIFEIIEDDWIVAEDALLHWKSPAHYIIPYSKLNECNWETHMRGKRWVDQAVFQNSLDVAVFLIRDGLANGALPDYLPGLWKK